MAAAVLLWPKAGAVAGTVSESMSSQSPVSWDATVCLPGRSTRCSRKTEPIRPSRKANISRHPQSCSGYLRTIVLRTNCWREGVLDQTPTFLKLSNSSVRSEVMITMPLIMSVPLLNNINIVREETEIFSIVKLPLIISAGYLSNSSNVTMSFWRLLKASTRYLWHYHRTA